MTFDEIKAALLEMEAEARKTRNREQANMLRDVGEGRIRNAIRYGEAAVTAGEELTMSALLRLQVCGEEGPEAALREVCAYAKRLQRGLNTVHRRPDDTPLGGAVERLTAITHVRYVEQVIPEVIARLEECQAAEALTMPTLPV